MEASEALKQVEEAMKKALEHTSSEFTSIRTGKASPALVENLDVAVAAYGSIMKLNGLAVITAPEPRMLVVQPFDPSTSGDIEKAIRESRLGLNPVNEGQRIRLPIPELSEERRVEMVKSVKSMAEEGRVRVRSARKEGMDLGKKMKSDNALTEDGQRDYESGVQDLTNKFVSDIDTMTESKEKEVMTV
ncbi:MAG: ribosome recycling factor [Akkermansiaceae bacterium]|jgi:ribosome recycling factor